MFFLLQIMFIGLPKKHQVLKRYSYKCLLSDEEEKKIQKNQILLVINLKQSQMKSVLSDPNFYKEVRKNLVVDDPCESQKKERNIKSMISQKLKQQI